MYIRASNKKKEEKLTIKKQQMIANSLFKHISKFGLKCKNSLEQCLVAGGAPRDWHRGVLANDIDFYVWNPFDATGFMAETGVNLTVKESAAEKEAKEKGSSFKGFLEKKKTSVHNYISLGDIIIVYEGIYQNQKFQIICMNPTKILKPEQMDLFSTKDIMYYDGIQSYLMRSFDFDICKMFYDGRKIITTKEALYDFENKTLTAYTKDIKKFDRLETMPARLEKLQKYFPGHTVRFLK